VSVFLREPKEGTMEISTTNRVLHGKELKEYTFQSMRERGEKNYSSRERKVSF